MDERQLFNEATMEANLDRYQQVISSIEEWLSAHPNDPEVLRLKARLDALPANIKNPKLFYAELHEISGQLTELKNRSGKGRGQS